MSPIRGDAKQLEIVFVNLIKNAAEAMTLNPSGALARELWLKGRQEGDWIVVSVKDSGPGIKRTDIAHLFEAYFTTKGSDGTGMGLFLSHQVIKAHGGAIDVKSEEGRGTEFIYPAAESDLAQRTQSGVHQGRMILQTLDLWMTIPASASICARFLSARSTRCKWRVTALRR